MFDVPNYPMHLIRKDSCSVSKEVTLNERRQKLLEKQECERISKTIEKGKKEFHNITYDQLWQMANRMNILENENFNLKNSNQKTIIESEDKIAFKDKEIEEKILQISKIYTENEKIKMDNAN